MDSGKKKRQQTYKEIRAKFFVDFDFKCHHHFYELFPKAQFGQKGIAVQSFLIHHVGAFPALEWADTALRCSSLRCVKNRKRVPKAN